MHYIVVPTQVWVFVFERVKAMRTRGDNLRDSITVHDCNVVHRLHLKQEFVSCSFCWITCTGLFFPKNGKIDIQMVKNFRHCFCYLLGAFVETSGTTYPE